MEQSSSLQEFVSRFQAIALGAFFFALPLSTSATEIAGGVFLGTWALSGRLTDASWLKARRLAPVVLLMLLHLVGALYAPAGGPALAALNKVRFLAYALAIPAMGFPDSAIRAAVKAFLGGLSLTCLIALLQFARVLPNAGQPPRFALFHGYMHGTLSLMLVFGLLLTAWLFRSCATPRERLGNALLAVLLLAALMLAIPGRIGYLAFLLALPFIVYSYVRQSFSLWVASALAVALLLPAFSPSLRRRVAEGCQDLAAYSQGRHDTSLGARLEMWKFAWQLFRRAPLAGNGAGAFEALWPAGKPAGIVANYTDPHNTFFQVAADFGIAGLAVLALFLFAVGRCAWEDRHGFRGYVGFCFLGIFLVGSLTNTMIAGLTNTVWTAAVAGLVLTARPAWKNGSKTVTPPVPGGSTPA